MTHNYWRFLVIAVLMLAIPALVRSHPSESPRIVAGKDAELGQFPYQAMLRIQMEKGRALCGGSLISEEWVLTAGHCVEGASSFEVHLGAVEFKEPEGGDGRTVLNATEFIRHEEYRRESVSNDIAVIKLPQRVPFSDRIRPVALPTGHDDYNRRMAIASGWGKTKDRGGAAQRLQYAPLKFATAAFDFAMAKRENTFRIDYSNIPRKPSGNELHEFLYKEIGLKEEDVLRLQCSRSLGCAFVKVKSLELAQQTVEQHDNMHEIEVDDKSYRLRFMMEDGTKEVKLYDLSEGTSEDKIIEFLKQYGEVLSIREQMWGDQARYKVSTGIRIVRMMVQKNIDSFVTIDGEKTAVSYYGQRQTCKHCLETVHNGITCVQNKQLQVQKSYADAAKQPGLKKSAPKPAKQKAKTKGTGDSPLVFKTVAQTSSNSTPVNTNTTSTVISNTECMLLYGPGTIQPSTICTRGENRQSTCNGDSGGPLVLEDDRTLIGVVSFGSAIGCERRLPVAFARVTEFTEWIRNKTGVAAGSGEGTTTESQ
ncbi:hypothetical protein quinque_004240 [Culex quinquefasciatus]